MRNSANGVHFEFENDGWSAVGSHFQGGSKVSIMLHFENEGDKHPNER